MDYIRYPIDDIRYQLSAERDEFLSECMREIWRGLAGHDVSVNEAEIMFEKIMERAKTIAGNSTFGEISSEADRNKPVWKRQLPDQQGESD